MIGGVDDVVEVEVFEEIADAAVGERFHALFVTVFTVGGVGLSAAKCGVGLGLYCLVEVSVVFCVSGEFGVDYCLLSVFSMSADGFLSDRFVLVLGGLSEPVESVFEVRGGGGDVGECVVVE